MDPGAMTEVERLRAATAVQIASYDPSHPDARYCLRSYVSELARRFDGGFDPALSTAMSPTPTTGSRKPWRSGPGSRR